MSCESFRDFADFVELKNLWIAIKGKKHLYVGKTVDAVEERAKKM